ncbi:MAG TPA: UDP-N-acetylmuramoyl-L-alanyl-D-glutamate--2,6-diaminopimelate ligase, partial [Phaeodactylibacter sp.]|nr:UDP-N-acetylmuramoyl-L-alanyl-D-glutamate--2,6-diaminopimelate ligase [Phaeodactylibacter sp.]
TDFSGAVFTNLTHDHLDYHGSFKAYLKAKKKLFDELLPKAFALINTDDKNGAVMVQNTRAKVYRYGLRQMADFKGKVLSADVHGMELLIDGVELHSPLSGEYNAYNLLAAYATARLLGMEKEETLTALSSLQGAEGRMQKVRAEGTSVLGIVDYAHTPDALEKVLSALRAGLQKGQRLLCVVGAGGDRDKAKRPKMAAIAAAYSDQLILTSDNPRSEDPDAILQDMQAGLSEEQMAKTLVITNRRQAIRTAAQLAREGDVILLAGKGHEKYQDIKGIKKPFDDVEELSKALKTRLTKEGA